jgi:hypothetical protein
VVDHEAIYIGSERGRCPSASNPMMEVCCAEGMSVNRSAAIVPASDSAANSGQTVARVWAGDQLTLLTAGGESAASSTVSVGN